MNSNHPENNTLFDSEEGAFREIFQSSNEGILVVDTLGTIIMANPVSEKLFGYDSGELSGESIDILVPDTVRNHHQAYRQVYNADPQPRSMGSGRDLHGRMKDGSEFPIEVSLSNVRINGNMFIVAFVIDITRRKNAEEALKESEKQLITYATELEQRVERRTQALNASVKKLEEINERLITEVSERKKAEKDAKNALAKERDLNELKSRFVSMASHEFRTPLSSILSSINLINRYKETNTLDKIDKHVDRIRNSVKNLTDILNDFLSLGKLEEGKVELDKELLNAQEFFENYTAEMEGILKHDQIFKLNIEKGLTFYSDERVLKNILTNLVSNASKYSSEGSSIDINVITSNNKIVIEIRDYGIGIPESEQRHLFERFFRAKNAINIQGTGLGLNIVKKYVELLNGEIGFSSELNKGTQVTLQFPLK